MRDASLIGLFLGLAGCTTGDGRRPPDTGVGGEADGGTQQVDAGSPTDAGPRPDVPIVPFDAGQCHDVVDVVFVLDVSSSMNFVLQALEADIPDVVAAAEELAPDPHFGFIGFADNHAFGTHGAGEVVHTEAATLRDAFREFRTTYTQNNRNPGDGPSGRTTQNPICEENSLDALYAAATDFPWRENATRVIILATDDTFLERPDNYGDRDGDGDTTSTSYPREGDYPARWTLAETVRALQDARIRVFSFTRLDPPGWFESRCGTPRRFSWSSISDGWSTPYRGADPIPDATDARNFDLTQVQSGRLNLADTISEVVVESYCEPVLI